MNQMYVVLQMLGWGFCCCRFCERESSLHSATVPLLYIWRGRGLFKPLLGPLTFQKGS